MSLMSKVQNAWQELDPAQNEHAKTFLLAVLENRKEADRRYSHSYYSFLLLAFLYYLLSVGAIEEASLFSVKLKHFDVLLWAIPVLMATALYGALCAFLFENYLRALSHSYCKKYLPTIYANDLEGLADFPSFFNFERLLSRSDGFPAKIAANFAGVLTAALLIFSHLFVLFLIINNVRHWASLESIALKIVLTTLGLCFVLRSAMMATTAIVEGE